MMISSKLPILYIGLILCSGLLCREASGTSAAEEPLWVEAVGEAMGDEYDPPKEVMERARNDAKRKAVDEAVGSFINSHTMVSNGQLAEDLTYARVRGKVEKVKIISEERGKSDPNLFRVTLKALVRPVLPDEEEGIRVKLSLSKALLKEGEEVRILYQVNTDSFVYIFSIAADNSVTLLFPNTLYKDNFVRANIGNVFPPDHSSIQVHALGLPDRKSDPSQEKVKVIATRQREILLERGFQEGLFQVYDARSTGLVGDLARKLNQLDPAEWGEAVVAFKIEPAKGGS